MAITKTATDYQTLFNDVEEVFFCDKEIKAAELGTASLIELPVSEDGVTLNTGDPDITQTKLTTGKIWASKAKRGDAEISFNVPSVSEELDKLFLNEKTGVSVTKADIGALGTFSGKGYSLQPKRVEGALVLPANDRTTVIVLPRVEIYASFVAGESDTPAYFSLKVTPLVSSEGAEIFILKADNEG